MTSVITQSVISLIVGGITFGITVLIVKKVDLTNVFVSILSFLIAMVVQLMIMVENVERQLDVTKVISEIDNNLLRHYAEVAKEDYEQEFMQLKEGTIRFNTKSSMMRAYYDIFQDEQPNLVSATSMVKIERVWSKKLGEKAIEVNKKAIKNGCKIVRVFIIEDQEYLESKQVLNQFTIQAAAGVDVHWVMADDLDRQLRRDFLITDTGVVLEYKIDITGDITECMLSTNSKKLSTYLNYFKQIKDAATKWKENQDEVGSVHPD